MRKTMNASQVQTVVRGRVPARITDYARTKTVALAGRVREPILFARVKLTMGRAPAVSRPAIAQAALDLDGRPVRARAAASTMGEAVDLLMDRLHRRLADAGEHRGLRHEGTAGPGRRRHGSEAAARPGRRSLPAQERGIVRRPSYALPWESPDEAVFEMDSMGYDFHLFTDSVTGVPVAARPGRDVPVRDRGHRHRLRRPPRPQAGHAYPLEELRLPGVPAALREKLVRKLETTEIGQLLIEAGLIGEA